MSASIFKCLIDTMRSFFNFVVIQSSFKLGLENSHTWLLESEHLSLYLHGAPEFTNNIFQINTRIWFLAGMEDILKNNIYKIHFYV
jgi:hypothetical protein